METLPEVSQTPVPKPSRKRSKEAGSDPTGIGLSAPPQVDEKDVIHVDSEIVYIGKRPRATPKDRVAQWLAIRVENPEITQAEAAEKIGIARGVLNKHINTGVREGWLQFDSPMDRLEHHIIHKVIRNLEKFLDKGDKTVTIEAAKGTIFNSYRESKGQMGSATTVLALKIETTHPEYVKITTGTILGKPKDFIDGAIKENEPQS